MALAPGYLEQQSAGGRVSACCAYKMSWPTFREWAGLPRSPELHWPIPGMLERHLKGSDDNSWTTGIDCCQKNRRSESSSRFAWTSPSAWLSASP